MPDIHPDSTGIPQQKGRFKKLAKHFYPAKMVGGARAVGGAIRHPMVATRKVNHFMHKKNPPPGSSKTTGGYEEPVKWPLNHTTDDLPGLARSMTINEGVDTQTTSPGMPY
jgi:hypothetical protein